MQIFKTGLIWWLCGTGDLGSFYLVALSSSRVSSYLWEPRRPLQLLQSTTSARGNRQEGDTAPPLSRMLPACTYHLRSGCHWPESNPVTRPHLVARELGRRGLHLSSHNQLKLEMKNKDWSFQQSL